MGVRVVPVRQQGAQRCEQHERLVQHGVVTGLRDLDHRGDTPKRVIHRGADVLRDEPVLGAQQSEPAANLS